jgi:hypothetical protein
MMARILRTHLRVDRRRERYVLATRAARRPAASAATARTGSAAGVMAGPADQGLLADLVKFDRSCSAFTDHIRA